MRIVRLLSEWRHWPLRQRLTAVLLAGALVPLVVVGGLAAVAVHQLSGSANRGVAALQAQARADFLSAADTEARREDQDLARVQAQAAAVAASARFLFDHPDLFPQTQQGNSDFEPTPGGALVSHAGSPVGVFVPQGATLGDAFWSEVLLLSHLDPFLETMYASRSPDSILRLWVLTPDGMIRSVPDPAYGHPGSPVTAGTNLTERPFFQTAGPARDPQGAPVWTAPYPDPAGGGAPVVTVSVPIRDSLGYFHGVAGADVSLPRLAQSLGRDPQGGLVGLFTADGGWVAGSAQAQSFYQQPAAGAAVGGHAGSQPALLTLSAPGGPQLVATAPLATPGWVLALAAPEASVLGPAASLAASARRTEREIEAVVLLACLVLLALLVAVARAVAAQTTQPIEALAERIRRTGTGRDGTAGPAAPAHDEVELVSREFAALESRLADAARQIQAEAFDRARAEQAGALQRLEERNALAREVHDSLAQAFVGALMLSEAAEADAAEGDWPAVLRRLGRLREVAREGLDRARASVRELVPPLDLVAELRRELATFDSDTETRLQVDGEARALPPVVRAALVGIAREALANARRHARAPSVEVRLNCLPTAATLEVRDDGVGFDPDAIPRGTPELRGFGLDSMQARVAAAGGRAEVTSAPGSGTRVSVEIPLAEAARASAPGSGAR